MSENKV